MTLLLSLAHLGLGPAALGTKLFREWAAVVTPHLSELGPSSLEGVVWSLAKLDGLGGVTLGADFWTAWTAAARDQFAFFMPRDASSALWALTKLGVVPALVSADFCAALLRPMRDKLAHVNMQDASSALWAVAKLGLRVDKALLVELCTAARAHFGSAKPRELASLVHSLAQLELGTDVLGISYFHAWAEACQHHWAQFRAHELPLLIWALSELDLGARMLGWDFFASWTEASCEALPAFSTQGLAMAISGVAKLAPLSYAAAAAATAVPNADWVARWVATSQPQLPSFTPRELASSLAGLSLLRDVAGLTAVVPAWLCAWLAASAATLHRFNAHELALCVVSLSKLTSALPGDHVDHLRRWSAALADGGRLGALTPRELSNTVAALVALQAGPDVLGLPFFVAWAEVCAARLPDFNTRDLSHCLWSMARLRLGPDTLGWGFFRAWNSAVRAQLATTNGSIPRVHDMVNMLDAVAALHLHRHALDAAFFAQWAAVCSACLSRFLPRDFVVVVRALASLGPEVAGALGPEFLPSWGAACIPRLCRLPASDLVTLLGALSKLAPPLVPASAEGAPWHAAWLRAWAAVAAGQNFSVTDVVQALPALVALGATPQTLEPQLLARWMTVVTAAYEHSSAPEAGRMVGSFVALCTLCVGAVDPALMRAWGHAADVQMGHLNCAQLGTMLAALAVLGPESELQAALWTRWLHAVQARIYGAPSHDLTALLVTACKNPGVPPAVATKFLPAWGLACAPRLSTFAVHELAAVVSAASDWNMADAAAEQQEQLGEDQTPPPTKRVSWTEMFARFRRARSVSSSGQLFDADFSTRWSSAMLPNLRHCSADQLALVINAMSRLSLRPEALVSGFYGEWLTAALPLLSTMSAAQLAVSITALSRLGMTVEKVGPPFYQEFAVALLPHLRACGARTLVTVLVALAKGGASSPVLNARGFFFFKEWSSAAAPLLRSMDGHSLAEILFSLAKLSIVESELEEEFFMRWAAASEPYFDSWTERDLANVNWSLSRLSLGNRLLGPGFMQKWSQVMFRKFGN